MFHSLFLQDRPSASELWISASHLCRCFLTSSRQARAKSFAEECLSIESSLAGILRARAPFLGPSISQIVCVLFDAMRVPHELELDMCQN